MRHREGERKRERERGRCGEGGGTRVEWNEKESFEGIRDNAAQLGAV